MDCLILIISAPQLNVHKILRPIAIWHFHVDCVLGVLFLLDVRQILKNQDLRQQYDDVLENGLPNWKQPIYYFRASAKLSVRGVALLMIMASGVMHYCALWAHYLEKTWSDRELIGAGRKKRKKVLAMETREDDDTQRLERARMRPSFQDIVWVGLVIRLFDFVWNMKTRQRQQEKDRAAAALAAAAEAEEQEAKAAAEAQRQRERQIQRDKSRARQEQMLQESQAMEKAKSAVRARKKAAHAKDTSAKVSPCKTGAFDEAERKLLTRLMNRFPGGTIDRWEVIAAQLNRDVKQVISEAHNVPVPARTGAAEAAKTVAKSAARQCSRGQASTADGAAGAAVFTQTQQNQLQAALRSVPKDAPDRWDQISAQVDFKSSEECRQRVRWLVAQARKKADQ
eukprot:m.334715 g.334715  ORF g.334715 m.334715 type:complete len:397 (-) comp20513_c0_seq2:515-1705(-)